MTKKNYYIRSQSKKILDKLEAATGGVIYKKVLLKNLQNLLCHSLFFNKVAGLWNLILPLVPKELVLE